MNTQLTELTEKLKKQQTRVAKHQRAAERTKAEIEELKKRLEEQRTAEPVVVAGIKWGGFLTPSENCKEPAHYNDETGMWYFSQPSAIMHAYEQNLRLPTAEEFQQLHDRTTHKRCERGGKYGMLFTDKETGTSVFFPASGYRDYSNGSFYGVTTRGYYWSSSVHNATHGYNLSFNQSNGVIPQNYYFRSYGFPVRCVSSVP